MRKGSKSLVSIMAEMTYDFTDMLPIKYNVLFDINLTDLFERQIIDELTRHLNTGK